MCFVDSALDAHVSDKEKAMDKEEKKYRMGNGKLNTVQHLNVIAIAIAAAHPRHRLREAKQI